MQHNNNFLNEETANLVMDCFYYRGQKCKHCEKIVPIFALGHHKSQNEGEDAFTKASINCYIYGNKKERNYFLSRLIELFNSRFKGDITFDLICVMPSHERDTLNANMVSLAKELSEKISVPFDQVLSRNKTVRNQHELTTLEDRMNNVRGSISVAAEKVKGKKVLVLDNTAITGSNCQEAFDTLIAAGAETVVFFCFGLGSKAKDCDFDLNPALKWPASKIIDQFHWPKVSKEKRDNYKQKKQDS